MPTPPSSYNSAGLRQIFHFHKVIPADFIFRLFQSKLIIEGELDPGALWGVEPPCQQEVPGVTAREARTVNAAIPCHADGLFFSVQVISPDVGGPQGFYRSALGRGGGALTAAKVRADDGVEEEEDEQLHWDPLGTGPRLCKETWRLPLAIYLSPTPCTFWLLLSRVAGGAKIK